MTPVPNVCEGNQSPSLSGIAACEIAFPSWSLSQAKREISLPLLDVDCKANGEIAALRYTSPPLEMTILAGNQFAHSLSHSG